MLGCIAAVRATESPSQLKPAGIQRTLTTVSAIPHFLAVMSSDWSRLRHEIGKRKCDSRRVARTALLERYFGTPVRAPYGNRANGCSAVRRARLSGTRRGKLSLPRRYGSAIRLQRRHLYANRESRPLCRIGAILAKLACKG